MNYPEGSTPRRVVYDVRPQPQAQPNNKRRRRGKKKQHEQVLIERISDEPVPLELAPLIEAAIDYGRKHPKGDEMQLAPVVRAAIEYGRKTHALGAMKAAKALANLAMKLKKSDAAPQLFDLIVETQLESEKIVAMFVTAYEEEQAARI